MYQWLYTTDYKYGVCYVWYSVCVWEREVWGWRGEWESLYTCHFVTVSNNLLFTYTSYTVSVTVSLCMDYLSIEIGYICVQIWQIYKCSSISLVIPAVTCRLWKHNTSLAVSCFQEVPTLKDIFRVGDGIPCRIVSAESKGTKRFVEVSAKPSDVNRTLPLQALKAGCVSISVAWVAVQSCS